MPLLSHERQCGSLSAPSRLREPPSTAPGRRRTENYREATAADRPEDRSIAAGLPSAPAGTQMLAPGADRGPPAPEAAHRVQGRSTEAIAVRNMPSTAACSRGFEEEDAQKSLLLATADRRRLASGSDQPVHSRNAAPAANKTLQTQSCHQSKETRPRYVIPMSRRLQAHSG